MWTQERDGIFAADLANVRWVLSVIFTGNELERKYFLMNDQGYISEIETRGGVYTALDIAEEFILATCV